MKIHGKSTFFMLGARLGVFADPVSCMDAQPSMHCLNAGTPPYTSWSQLGALELEEMEVFHRSPSI